MSPQWRAVKKLIEKVNLGLESYDSPTKDRIGDDELSFADIDTDTRKEMLKRQNKVMHGMLDKVVASEVQEAALLEGVDTWMVTAANKLEQDDDEGGLASAAVRPNATVGQLLNHQTEKGAQLSKVQSKMSQMMTAMRKDKERGDAALARCEVLDKQLKTTSDSLAEAQSTLKDAQARHDSSLHASRMQMELLARQRDEARDEAAVLRTSMRKVKKEEAKAESGLLKDAKAEIRRLMEVVTQKDNLLRKAEADVADLNRQLAEVTAREIATRNRQPAAVAAEPVIKEVVREVLVEAPKPEVSEAEAQTDPMPEPEVVEKVVEKVKEVDAGPPTVLMNQLRDAKAEVDQLKYQRGVDEKKHAAALSEVQALLDAEKAAHESTRHQAEEEKETLKEDAEAAEHAAKLANDRSDMMQREVDKAWADMAANRKKLAAKTAECDAALKALAEASAAAAAAGASGDAAAAAADAAAKMAADAARQAEERALELAQAQAEVLTNSSVLRGVLLRLEDEATKAGNGEAPVPPLTLYEIMRAQPLESARETAMELLGLMDPTKAAKTAGIAMRWKSFKTMAVPKVQAGSGVAGGAADSVGEAANAASAGGAANAANAGGAAGGAGSLGGGVGGASCPECGFDPSEDAETRQKRKAEDEARRKAEADEAARRAAEEAAAAAAAEARAAAEAAAADELARLRAALAAAEAARDAAIGASAEADAAAEAAAELARLRALLAEAEAVRDAALAAQDELKVAVAAAEAKATAALEEATSARAAAAEAEVASARVESEAQLAASAATGGRDWGGGGGGGEDGFGIPPLGPDATPEEIEAHRAAVEAAARKRAAMETAMADLEEAQRKLAEQDEELERLRQALADAKDRATRQGDDLRALQQKLALRTRQLQEQTLLVQHLQEQLDEHQVEAAPPPPALAAAVERGKAKVVMEDEEILLAKQAELDSSEPYRLLAPSPAPPPAPGDWVPAREPPPPEPPPQDEDDALHRITPAPATAASFAPAASDMRPRAADEDAAAAAFAREKEEAVATAVAFAKAEAEAAAEAQAKDAEREHRKEVRALKQSIAELEKKVADLEGRVEEAQRLRKEAAEASLGADASAKGMVEKQMALEEELRDLKARHTEVRKEMLQTKAREKMKNTLLYIANQGKASEKNRAQVFTQSLSSEVRSLEAKLAASELELVSAREGDKERAARHAAEIDAVRAELETRLEEARSAREAAEAEHTAAMAAEGQAHAAALADAEGREVVLRERMEASERNEGEARASLAKAQEELAREKQTRETNAAVAKEVLEQTRRERDGIKSERDAVKAEKEEAVAALELAKDEAAKFERSGQTLQLEIEQLKHGVAAAEARAAEALEIARAEQRELNASVEEERQAMGQVRKELAEAQEAMQQLRGELEARDGEVGVYRAQVESLKAKIEESKKSGDAIRVIALRLQREANAKKLAQKEEVAAELRGRQDALEDAVRAARDREAAERMRAAKAVADAESGGKIAAAYWRKQVQLATVKAIMLDRKAEEWQLRAEESERAVLRLANEAGGLAESESLRIQVVKELEEARQAADLLEAALTAADAREAALAHSLAEKSRQHEEALVQMAGVRADLEEALPLAGWRQQAVDVIKRDEQLQQEITSAATRIEEFNARVGALQERIAAAEASDEVVAARHMLERMGEKQRAEAAQWEERKRRLEQQREGNWLRGISTLGLMMATAQGAGSSGELGQPTQRAIPRAEFYNRQSTTINRHIYSEAAAASDAAAAGSSRPQTRDGSGGGGNSGGGGGGGDGGGIGGGGSGGDGGSRPLSPLIPQPPYGNAVAHLQLAGGGGGGRGGRRGKPATSVPTPSAGREGLAPGAAPPPMPPRHPPPSPPRPSLPELMPNLGQELSGAIARAAEGGSAPQEAAGAMGALFEAAVRLAWGSSPRPYTSGGEWGSGYGRLSPAEVGEAAEAASRMPKMRSSALAEGDGPGGRPISRGPSVDSSSRSASRSSSRGPSRGSPRGSSRGSTRPAYYGEAAERRTVPAPPLSARAALQGGAAGAAGTGSGRGEFMSRTFGGGRRAGSAQLDGRSFGAATHLVPPPGVPLAATVTTFPTPPQNEERSADVLAIYGAPGGGREGMRSSEGVRAAKPSTPRAQQRAAQLPPNGPVDPGELPALTMRKVARPQAAAPPLSN